MYLLETNSIGLSGNGVCSAFVSTNLTSGKSLGGDWSMEPKEKITKKLPPCGAIGEMIPSLVCSTKVEKHIRLNKHTCPAGWLGMTMSLMGAAKNISADPAEGGGSPRRDLWTVKPARI